MKKTGKKKLKKKLKKGLALLQSLLDQITIAPRGRGREETGAWSEILLQHPGAERAGADALTESVRASLGETIKHLEKFRELLRRAPSDDRVGAPASSSRSRRLRHHQHDGAVG